MLRLRKNIKRFYSQLHSGAASFSTTKIFFDISVDNQPAGRIIFKIYDDLPKFTEPYCTNFIKLATGGSFEGSEFQRYGEGRGDGAAFSSMSKPGKDMDLVDLSKQVKKGLNLSKHLVLSENNPLLHDREGLLTAMPFLPKRTEHGVLIDREGIDFTEQFYPPDIHRETLYYINYDPDERFDGRFQVIGEVEEGWDALIELECACVQPISYYYPNQQHLIALMEQTGDYNNPALLERIALGLKTDTHVPGLMESQLAIDSGKSNVYEDMKANIPIALHSHLESKESAEAKEVERWKSIDALSELDVHSHNKAQKFPILTNKDERVNLPTVGPGPMTASAIITKSGIYERERIFLSSPLTETN